jgi:hypothetical protein
MFDLSIRGQVVNRHLQAAQLGFVKFLSVNGSPCGQAGRPLKLVGQLAIRGGSGFCDRRGQWKKIRMGAQA